jgi:transcriptional regulator with XRE-family HTH domain
MRPANPYGGQVRHIPTSESDTWATLVRGNRERLGLSQKGLGDRLGVTRETIGRWESGRFRPDSIDVAEAAIRALGIHRPSGLRAAGYLSVQTDEPPEPPMWTFARSLGLDPADENVHEILTAGWSGRTTEHMLREERRLQEEDRRRRLERIRLAREMYEQRGDEGGVDQAAG